jgi:hypothetical protein
LAAFDLPVDRHGSHGQQGGNENDTKFHFKPTRSSYAEKMARPGG